NQPGLQTAIDTYFHDPDVVRFRDYKGWKQDAIWAARLGLVEEAKELVVKKFLALSHRFPAFWGPGFDWTPDHNWGGSAMIALQEMLLQTVGDTTLVLPALPAGWDVHFKLCAPRNKSVECKFVNGKIEKLETVKNESL
ncbi:MAG: hypothetical protein LBE91_12635, partial [Tannerella sp.]|nr:hypothetical protein [Tannerella sp.]